MRLLFLTYVKEQMWAMRYAKRTTQSYFFKLRPILTFLIKDNLQSV